VVSVIFPLRNSIGLLAICMALFMMAMPFIEAAEQTVLQRLVPFERQGRVFGFQQTVEQSVSPIMAFLIGPLAQWVFMPFMTTGKGVDWIGGWFGTGENRGIALVFVVSGVIGLTLTTLALASRYYRDLSASYRATLVAA
jgi:DHA3 family multidrug efflux protein-like MFS transporter